MHHFTVDYSKDRPDPRVLHNRGYFIHGLPRLIPRCRVFGHRPVVDGYDSKYGDRERRRWVTCSRCGIRPEPQGHLDPEQWSVGQRYTGPFNPGQPMSPVVRKQLLKRGHDEGIRQPGAWPAAPTGDLGAQLVIGRSPSLGFEIKVGNSSSEHPLDAHIGLGPFGALYVHTESFGRGVQRRLNPTGYDSRVTGIDFHRGRLYWHVWAKRDESSRSDPRWMRGSVAIDPRHYILGSMKATRACATDKVDATVHMPDGTHYPVTVQVETWTRGRARGRKTTSYTLDWDCKPGIPVRNHSWKGDEYFGGSFPFPDADLDSDQWVQQACAAIADHCAKDRARYNYRAPAA